MFRRRARSEIPPALPVAPFLDALEEVEAAKAAIVAAVPSARAPGLPLAEALFEFDHRLAEAGERMAGWRATELEDTWERCREGIEEARRGGDRLRLEAPGLDFESMVFELSDLIAPLEAFEAAELRFRELGASLRR